MVIALGHRKTAQIQPVSSGCNIRQWHQVLAVGADVCRVVIHGAFASLYGPLQGRSRDEGGNCHAIIDARFNFRPLFIIVPGYELQIGQLLSRTVEAIDFGKCLQPGLSTLLLHDPVGTPSCESVVKPFVCCAHRLSPGNRHSGVIKTGEIAHSVIGCGRHHP